MKKILALSAALTLVSAQAFAQTAETPAQSTDATTAPAAAAPVATGPFASLSAKTGLSNGAMVAIGVAIASTVAIVAGNDDDTTTSHAPTTHSTTTHH